MDDIFEEEEEDQEEEQFFSASDLLQIREALFLLLKNFLRLLSKFSLKEKPQCIQACIQVGHAIGSNVALYRGGREVSRCVCSGCQGHYCLKWQQECQYSL